MRKIWIVMILVVGLMAGCSGRGGNEESGVDEDARLRATQHLESGEDSLMDGDKEQALASYTKSIETDPSFAKAYVCRAMYYQESGDYDQAMRDYTRAIELEPKSSYPYEQRARIYRDQMNDEDRAKADEEAAEMIRQKRWSDLKELKRP